jgi:putative peptide zinc metalloprotease protein
MTVAGAEPSATDPPLERLDSGVELLGRYEQSGYSGEQYLLRRPDGQVLQLSKLLYLVASALRATSSLQEAAEQVSGQFGKLVSAENIEYLIDNKLRQLDIFERRPGHPRQEATGTTESGRSVAPRQTGGMLSLRFRRALFPARAHLRITVALQRLFDRRVAGVVLVALLAADAWLLARGAGRVLGGATQTLEHPVLLLVLLGLIALANVFHEFGHAAATTYGAKPGAMGAGVYLAMPVFFTDVTDSYRLDRNGRLRVDLGGVYFNAIAVLAALAVYAPTHFKLLLLFAVLVQMEALLQFLPFVRLDGYYVVADLIGVPNHLTARGIFRCSRPGPGGQSQHGCC